MKLKDKKVMVVGTGISGIGAVSLLNHAEAEVILYDGNVRLDKQSVLRKLGQNKAELLIGDEYKTVIDEIDLLVISPGVPIDSPLVLELKEKGIPVWGEIELAFNFEKGTVFAITGTNGKTTTTALVGQIAAAYNKKTYVVGNIGNSYTGEVLNTSTDSYTIAEISSFQLESVENFHPEVSAILNLTPDHLNRHHTMQCYAETKERICENQNANQTCVLNYDDKLLREFGERLQKDRKKVQVVWFSRKEKPVKGVYMEGDRIMYTDGENDCFMLNVYDINLIGVHNYENVMAAIALTKAAGIPEDIIVKQTKKFQAVEHRIEYVAEKNQVIYYNDSKGTNPEAAVKAIEAMSRPTILIGGGYDKGSEFDLYVKAFEKRVKLLVLIGQTSDQIERTCKRYGFTSVVRAKTLEEAVDICAKEALPGDAVLLSPACASWGMFDNYEQRGNVFKECVQRL